MSAIARAIAYSIPTKTVGTTLIGALSIDVEDIENSFPDLLAGQHVYAVLCSDEAASDPEADFETVKVTAITAGTPPAGTLTVVRGQEVLSNGKGAAKEWPAGTTVFCPLTKAAWEELLAAIADTVPDHEWSGTSLRFELPEGGWGDWVDLVGPQGEPGAKWYEGDGAPSSGLGIDGDFYLNDLTGDVYQKSSGSWAVVANIEGPQGIQGPKGDTGEIANPVESDVDFDFYKAFDVDIKNYVETLATATWDSATQTINLQNGNVHKVSVTAAVTSLSFTNPSAGAHSFTLILEQDATGRAITWPASVDWPGGTAPTIDGADEVHILEFFTPDSGTTWYGFHAGSDMG